MPITSYMYTNNTEAGIPLTMCIGYTSLIL